MTHEPERVKDIVLSLDLIGKGGAVGLGSNWRRKRCAEASQEITRLRSLLSVSEKRAESLGRERDEARAGAELVRRALAISADDVAGFLEQIDKLTAERDSSQASLLRVEAETVERCAKWAESLRLQPGLTRAAPRIANAIRTALSPHTGK